MHVRKAIWSAPTRLSAKSIKNVMFSSVKIALLTAPCARAVRISSGWTEMPTSALMVPAKSATALGALRRAQHSATSVNLDSSCSTICASARSAPTDSSSTQPRQSVKILSARLLAAKSAQTAVFLAVISAQPTISTKAGLNDASLIRPAAYKDVLTAPITSMSAQHAHQASGTMQPRTNASMASAKLRTVLIAPSLARLNATSVLPASPRKTKHHAWPARQMAVLSVQIPRRAPSVKKAEHSMRASAWAVVRNSAMIVMQ